MKIAMVSINAGPLAWLGGVDGGGQSVLIDCLSGALARLGHDVTIYTRREDPALPSCLTTTSGVHVHHLEITVERAGSAGAPEILEHIAAFETRLTDEWRRDPPHIAHAHGWTSGRAAIGAARALRLPVVATFHGLGTVKPPRRDGGEPALRVAAEAQVVRDSVRLVATCSAEVFGLLRMGASPGAIKLIPCGVDLELFAPQLRTAAPGTPFRIATLGRLVEDAGVGDVIEALAYVPGAQLTVGGGRGGPDELAGDADARRLSALAHARGVAERVTFAGRVKRDDAAPFLRAADVFICVPHEDSTGTVALEAMACGVPVIVSSVGALVDAVADGINGTHVSARSPRQLAYAIEALKNDAARRVRFGRLGVERASARYGWPRIAAETLDVYASVAAPARAGRMRG